MLLKNTHHTTKKRATYLEGSGYHGYDAVLIGK
jgi:hypothetical protein